MVAPVLTYSLINGKRVVSVSGSRQLPTDRTAAPAGTLDLQTQNGNVKLKVGNDLPEPLDVAIMRGRI
jgi:hypothetical protein